MTAFIETAPANSEHDADGRFKPGNKGGPGNPFAGKVALMRQAIFECLTMEDFHAIVRRLIEMAKEGHWQAAKLLMTYLLGKPQPGLNGQEVEMYLNELPPPSANGASPLSARADQPDGASHVANDRPSTNGEIAASPPSTNGDFAPTLNRQQRRALRKARRLAKQQRNSPPPAARPAALA